MPIYIKSKTFWKIRGIIFLFLIVFTVFILRNSIEELNQRIFYLSNKHNQAPSPGLTLGEKMSVYGLNILMAVSTFAIYPEIAAETILLVIPPPSNGIRTFDSDFALRSSKVSSILKQFNQDLKQEKTLTKVSFEKNIVWSTEEYILGKPEARYALTLNPCKMIITAIRKGEIWELQVSLKVKCKYPKHSILTLIKYPELKIEEGLFWVLQEDGWLFPYIAEWKFKIDNTKI
ncbi:MAG: hypothetical protein SFU98_16970 [Leptospiraceae bacterium]|nr:hypothetical protein [Leptospiraceae bacterium]